MFSTKFKIMLYLDSHLSPSLNVSSKKTSESAAPNSAQRINTFIIYKSEKFTLIKNKSPSL